MYQPFISQPFVSGRCHTFLQIIPAGLPGLEVFVAVEEFLGENSKSFNVFP